MPYRIAIQPSGHRFTANEGETVLEAALRQGVRIAYGCRNGACGTCKGRLLEGTVEYGAYREQALSEAEQRAGYALLCCARPRSDLALRCREVSAVSELRIRTLPARVQKMRRLAPDVMQLLLKLPAGERLQYLAGQYLDLMLKDGTRRSFSLANSPHDDALLELHLRDYGGPFSRHVFDRLKERDILRCEGPFGTFFLREQSEKPVILLAGGTGFAPIKAIVEYALHAGVRRPMTLYWGARTRAGLYLHELAQRWQREGGIRYVPVLSEAPPQECWRGRTGLVHRAVMEDFPDLSGHQVYACGTPAMVEAAHRDFTGCCGLPETEFYSDAFTPYAGAERG